MRFVLILLLSFTIVLGVSAQNNCSLMHDANWIWRGSDTMDLKRTTVQISFTQDTFVIDTVQRPMEIGSQNCVISNTDGHLLFYSNGCFIADAMDEPIFSSDTLNPGDIFNSQCKGREGSYIGSQCMFSIPAPGNDSLYYIFHKKFEYILKPSFHLVVDRLFLTEIVTSDVVSSYVNKKNIIVLSDTNIISSYLTATRHGNGIDWWIMTHTAYGNGFFRVLVDSYGSHLQEVQYIGKNTLPEYSAGQMKFSPDGSKVAMYHSKSGVYLFDFDRQTGMLSNDLSFGPIDSSFIIGGCEFSPSGRFLYVNTLVDVYQYDMHASDIAGSEIHLGHYDGYLTPRGLATRFFQMESTPNGQIFMNSPNGVNVLHVIEEPDKPGLECSFMQHRIILPANIYWSMPHFPNYRLGALEEPPCDTTVSVLDEPAQLNEIRVYPNPVHENLHLEINSGSMTATATLFDVTGRRVKSFLLSERTTTLDVHDLTPGLYILHIAQSDKVSTMFKVLMPE